ncbi:hypothetical protein FRC10_010562 [Ceratobasidium sp. 414]|nr:hypothetical protein FRC10_010562 [Ceratobasidium sp. 414]
MNEPLTDLEEASGRATRARTRLIVEGFANLALVAILFSGVQAQLISVANGGAEADTSKLGVATNAVFFGGLIFSVFAAMLATRASISLLSGRWFSILREDDSDYLSSCWLAQDCAEHGTEKGPKLEGYLEFQIQELEAKVNKERARAHRDGTSTPAPKRDSAIGILSNQPGVSPTSPRSDNQASKSPQNEEKVPQVYNPIVDDLERIIKLLKIERENGSRESLACKKVKPGPTTLREHTVSMTLLSPLVVCCAAFLLFCTGILMLAWNKQPRPVAIFTSATVLVCVIPLACFFLRHRHKHVIQKLNLARPAL